MSVQLHFFSITVTTFDLSSSAHVLVANVGEHVSRTYALLKKLYLAYRDRSQLREPPRYTVAASVKLHR